MNPKNSESDLAAAGMIPQARAREYYSIPEPPFGSLEEGRRLIRAFVTIKNPAVRNAILDMVSELAARDAT